MVLQCHNHVFKFISPHVGHWCKPTKLYANLSVPVWKNIAIPVDEAERSSACLVYAYPGHVDDTMMVHCNSWDYGDKYKQRSARCLWHLVCPRTWLQSLADAVYMCGVLFVVPMTGYTADTTGRQPVCQLTLLQKYISWRLMQVIAVTPTMILLSASSVVFESPIWMICMGHMEEADVVMFRAARINGPRRIEAELTVEAMRSDLSRSNASLSMSFRIIAKSGGIRVRAVSVFFSNFTVMFAFFIITGSSHLQEQGVVRITSDLLLAPSYLAMYYALNSCGSLKLLLILLALLGGLFAICGIAIYASPVEVSYVLVIAVKATASVLIPTNYLYIIELFPTAVRSAVMCGAYTNGRVGAVLAAFLAQLKYIGREDLGFARASVGALTNIMVVMQLPETSVRTNVTE
ncbi:carcinine transporter-like [Dermacentor variabilis]|uniref:carcinine transporter-like n=1 Tax=Dermacentor variabilis TaxID=34621 RepID=UPI003F5C0CAB